MRSLHYDFLHLSDHMERFRDRLRIAVVVGGDANQPGRVLHRTHNPRPWKSYEDVASDIAGALRNNGFRHVTQLPEDIHLTRNLASEGIHLVWLNTGGVQGYDPMSHAPAVLEMAGMPYVGHNPLNSTTLDNKRIFKHELRACGIPTSPFLSWDSSRGILDPARLPRPAYVFENYNGPFVVKPVTGRASLHVTVVESIEDLPREVARIYEQTQHHVLIERYLPGREYCVAVAGPVTHSQGSFTKRDKPFAFSVLERVLEKDERIFTSMDKKAISADRARLVQEPELKKKIAVLAQQIYLDFNLKTLVRLDLREDHDGTISVLECNPKPDLARPSATKTSLVAMGLGEHGMSYDDLILSLLADRVDFLLTHRARNIPHIVELLIGS
jgi:D-alanine-D-alanine ligase